MRKWYDKNIQSGWESSFYKQNKKKNHLEFCKTLPDDPFIILYLHVQIEICSNKTDSNNIFHLNIQAKTAKVVQ